MHERIEVPPTLPPARLVPGVDANVRGRGRIQAFVLALRPKQWVKNALVFAAPGAAGLLGKPDILARAGLGFIAMCVISSATYLVNDVADAEADRAHPVRRGRPVAAGRLSVRTAIAGATGLFVLGIGLSLPLGAHFLAVVLVYVGVTTAYSFGVKRVAVFDLVAVASCFVLRAIAGGAATHVTPSMWFLILTSSGALLVVVGKRQADLRSTADGGAASMYPAAYLRGVWVLAAGVAITAYCLWAFAEPHLVDGIAWSQVSIVPFAVALLRYAYLIELGEGGAPEEVFLHDRALQATVVVWILSYGAGVYLR
ncbi:MAG: decaprenyl-phosphate phosphoribosyltransferase [Actinomycetota bacterium]